MTYHRVLAVRRLSLRTACALALGGAIVVACSDDSPSTLTDPPASTSQPPGGAAPPDGGAAPSSVDAGGALDATSPPADGRAPADAADGSVTDANPGDGGLPAKILGIYFFMYNSPRLATIQAQAPQYNVVYYAFALGTNNGGNISFSVPSQAGGDANFKTDMAAWKASGRTAILSVGGGSNNGLNLQGAAQAAQFMSTITPAIDTYGFQGIDWDLETGGSTYDVATVVSISRQLKTKYGPSFVISLVPRPYEFRSGGSEIYRSIATQLGKDCDLIGFQFYDYPESNNASQQASIIHDDITDAVKAVPASKLLIGAEAPNAGLAWSPSSVYRDAYKTMNSATGGLRGAFIWDSPNEQASGWDFAKTVGPVVFAP
jgi:Glycosyl hydrolases family 18